MRINTKIIGLIGILIVLTLTVIKLILKKIKSMWIGAEKMFIGS